MDKIKNISLGGFSFIIEETAYNALNNYLNEVRNHLNQNTDREEILYDVEQRMAAMKGELDQARAEVQGLKEKVKEDVDLLCHEQKMLNAA